MVSPQYSGPISAGTDTSITNSAEQLPNTPCRGALLQADPNNTADIFLGDENSQPVQLVAGQSLSIRTPNLNRIYAIAASGTQVLNWILEL